MMPSEYAIQKRRERQREYYQRNRERILAYHKEYAKRNRDKLRQYHAAYMREYRLRDGAPRNADLDER